MDGTSGTETCLIINGENIGLGSITGGQSGNPNIYIRKNPYPGYGISDVA